MRAAVFVFVAATALDAQSPLRLVDADFRDAYGSDYPITGDFDGDGDLDQLLRDVVYVNDGHGNFAKTPTTGLTASRGGGVAGDFDGDGRDDLLENPSSTLPYLRVLRSTPAGFVAGPPPPAFATPPSAGYPFGGPWSAYVRTADVGDVDGDGLDDAVVCTFADVRLWRGVGGGAFAPFPTAAFPTTALAWPRAFLRDGDGDGDLDVLAVSEFDASAVWAINNGFGAGFTLVSAALAPAPGEGGRALTGDFNGDGAEDLAVVRTNAAGVATFSYLPGAAGGPLARVDLAAPNVVPWAAADLDANGVDELLGETSAGVGAWSTAGAALSLLSPFGSGAGFGREPSYSRFGSDPAARDFDGDGDLDVAGVSFGGEARFADGTTGPQALFMNDGAGTMVPQFGRAVGLPLTGAAAEVLAGDLDGDGDRDLLHAAVGYSPAGPTLTLTVHRNEGDGTYVVSPANATASSSLADRYALVDVDGDGDADLFCAGTAICVVPNLGGGVFGAPAIQPGSLFPTAMAAADFDYDGDVDVLVGQNANPATPRATMLVENLGGSFAAPVAVGSFRNASAVLPGDFDGDGLLDALVVGRVHAGPLTAMRYSALLLNTAVGGFVEWQLATISGAYAAAGDVNGDGLTDAVVDGQLHLAAPGGPVSSSMPTPLVGHGAFVDIDEDGALDLVESTGAVFFASAPGVFQPPVGPLPRVNAITVGAASNFFDAADCDGDGDTDVLSAGPAPSGSQRAVRLLENGLRGVRSGTLVRVGRPARLDLRATGNGAWQLYASLGTASLPTPFGTVLIDPASAILAAFGAADAAGDAALGLAVPNAPALAGLTLHWQLADLTTVRLSNRATTTIGLY